jgi:hypothetical protein
MWTFTPSFGDAFYDGHIDVQMDELMIALTSPKGWRNKEKEKVLLILMFNLTGAFMGIAR